MRHVEQVGSSSARAWQNIVYFSSVIYNVNSLRSAYLRQCESQPQIVHFSIDQREMTPALTYPA